MSADPIQIQRAATLLCEPGQVVELRILNTRRRTVSGYFNDPGKLALSAGEWSGRAAGVYMTLNPVNPALISRAVNRLQEYAKQTTGDTDIVKRQWLSIDF